MHKFIFSLIFFFGLLLPAVAQDDPPADPDEKESFHVRSAERIDFIFSRAFIIPGSPPDEEDEPGEFYAPYSTARSGSYYFGVSINFPVSRLLSFKVEPGFSWMKIVFDQEQQKLFPTDSIFTYEKHRIFYLEAPVGVRFNLRRDEEEKVKIFLETGFTGGIMLNNSYKRKIQDPALGKSVTQKIDGIDNVNMFRFGPYLRLGTNWISTFFLYRISPIYDTDEKYTDPNNPTREIPYPDYGSLEIGISLVL